jgi:hypothetical protein
MDKIDDFLAMFPPLTFTVLQFNTQNEISQDRIRGDSTHGLSQGHQASQD